MEILTKNIYSILAVIIVLLAAGLSFTASKLHKTSKALSESRLAEGYSLLHQAKQADRIYPDTLLYAARAIGFAGQGIDSEENTNVIPYITPDDTEAWNTAKSWIESRNDFRPVWSFTTPGSKNGIEISPHGRYLIVSSHGESALWDFAKAEFTTFENSTEAAFHPGGERYAFLSGEAVVIREGNKVTARHEISGTAIAYSPGGNFLAIGKDDGSVALIGEDTFTLPGKTGSPVRDLAFGPRGATLAATDGKSLRIWHIHEGALHPSWTNHSGEVSTVAFHPDPETGTIATGGHDGSISIWKIYNGKKIVEIDALDRHRGAVTALSFQSDGKRLISAGADGKLRLWDMTEQTPRLNAVLSAHGDPISDVEFLPCGTMAASSAGDSVIIWDLNPDKSPENLYHLIEDVWYIFDPAKQQFSSIIENHSDLPDDSLLKAWQTGKTEAWADRLLQKKNLLAAGLLGSKQKAAAAFESALKNSTDVNLARLYNRQKSLLGFSESEIGATVSEGKNFSTPGGIEMIWCKPGTFLMGEIDGPDFAKQHEVTLSSGYWLGKHEITRANYKEIMEIDPSVYKETSQDSPVENVNWNDATTFCNRLTGLARSRGTIPTGWRYALPTEAQWEYACRAGTTTTWSFGDDESAMFQHGNFDDVQGSFSDESDPTQDDGHKYAAPAGSYPANPRGFHDMHGNVFEWCRDSLSSSDPNYPEGPVTDPVCETGSLRVIRGGGFDGTAAESRSAYRDANPPQVPSPNLGFRIALVRE